MRKAISLATILLLLFPVCSYSFELKILSQPYPVTVYDWLNIQLKLFSIECSLDDIVQLDCDIGPGKIRCAVTILSKNYVRCYKAPANTYYSVAFIEQLLKAKLRQFESFGISPDDVVIRVFDGTDKGGPLKELAWD